jgi:hypothetical protein
MKIPNVKNIVIIAIVLCLNSQNFAQEINPNNFDTCPSPDISKRFDWERYAHWDNCWGRYEAEIDDRKGDVIQGEWKKGLVHGIGMYIWANGNIYFGEFKHGQYGYSNDRQKQANGIFYWNNGDKYVGQFYYGRRDSEGIFIKNNGEIKEGIWEWDKFINEKKVSISFILENLNKDPKEVALYKNKENITKKSDISTHEHAKGKTIEYSDNSSEKQRLAEERRIKESERSRREKPSNIKILNLIVSTTTSRSDGEYTLFIRTNADTASLKLNGEELGGRADGVYVLNRVARAGQDTKLDIVARDVNGNTDTKSIVETRTVADSAPRYASLDPARVKTRASTDSVAIIIGIQNYKRVPKAEFDNSDATAFYDYAIRALGIKPENIKLLLDEQADEVEILTAFKSWLPVKVKKAKTDVYVFYSGHGLPSDDGKSLYILPIGAGRQFIDKTALNQQEIITAIQSVSPKSVTMFMDACYSGQIRNGDTLLASARPISVKSSANQFPAEFTVFTASASDQIASSSPELKHGIFSYYVMKGMEGDADENKDGRITAGELHRYESKSDIATPADWRWSKSSS